MPLEVAVIADRTPPPSGPRPRADRVVWWKSIPRFSRAARRASAAFAAGSVSPSPNGPAVGSRSGGPLLLELELLELFPELPESFSGPLPGAPAEILSRKRKLRRRLPPAHPQPSSPPSPAVPPEPSVHSPPAPSFRPGTGTLFAGFAPPGSRSLPRRLRLPIRRRACRIGLLLRRVLAVRPEHRLAILIGKRAPTLLLRTPPAPPASSQSRRQPTPIFPTRASTAYLY